MAKALPARPAKGAPENTRAWLHYSGVEIAAAIGRSDCATRTLMSRARVKVRDRVAAAA